MPENASAFLIQDIESIDQKIKIFSIEERFIIYKAIVTHFLTKLDQCDKQIVINDYNKNQLKLFGKS